MKNLLLLTISLLLANIAFAQPNSGTPSGGRNATVQVLGGLFVDSALVLPWGTGNQFRGKGLDTTGRVYISRVDSLPRYMKKGVTVKQITEFDSNKVYVAFSQKGAPLGVATLGTDGKIPPGQISVVAISQVFVDNTVTAMLGHGVVPVGTVSVRTDSNKSFILFATPSDGYANWIPLTAAQVATFNGRTGVVVPRNGDYVTDSVTEGVNNLYFTTARVANKLNISDTPAMLAPYLRNVDTPAMLANYIRKGQAVTSVTAGGGLSGGTITGTGTVSLPNVGTAGTYGGSSGIPVITTDAYGRATSITTVAPATGGTVSSVGLSMPSSVYSVSASPVTSTGTLGVTYKTQTNNLVFAGPAFAPAAAPSFRALVAADIPSLAGSGGYFSLSGNTISSEPILGNLSPSYRVKLVGQNTTVGYLTSNGLALTTLLGIGGSTGFGKITVGDPSSVQPGYGGVTIDRNSSFAGRVLDVNQINTTGSGAIQRWLSTNTVQDSISNDGSMWLNGGLIVNKGMQFSGLSSTVTFKSGTNARVGTGTLVAGVATISTTTVSANSIIVITPTGMTSGSSCATCGSLGTGTIVPGTSFEVVSASNTDTRTFTWVIFEKN